MTLEGELLVAAAVLVVVRVDTAAAVIIILLGVGELLGPVAVGAAPHHDHGEDPGEDEVLREGDRFHEVANYVQ